ncbi:YciI family protein [Streptomyces sp. NPDC048266]|uniref:YciI family protein n=1 Tax=Streptomyces sp. NPDC048266 TaxID=3155787 RepID=UPI003402DEAB
MKGLIMDYVVLIYRDESKDGEVDWDQLGKDYADYVSAAVQAGVMRGGQKLQPSATATTVAVREGERMVTDGPFAEAREQLGGFFVLECADLDEALEWGARCPGAIHGTVEVRPVMPA